MELRQLRYFLAVADELHFGRAARRLHMSQPPLSVQVSRLEQEVGLALFERSTRSVALTPAGRHLQERARRILDDVDDVRAEMRALGEGVTGQLTVGFVSSANYTLLPEAVRLFRTRRDRVELTLVPLTSGEQLDQLRSGSLDLGIIRDELTSIAPTSQALASEVIFEEQLVVCVPATHPLATRTELGAADLLEVPTISYPHSLMPGYTDRVHEALGLQSGALRVVEQVVHQETALGFVAAGVGVSVLPESVRRLAPPGVVVVPLRGRPTTRLIAARGRAAQQSALSGAFLSCLREVASTLSPPQLLKVG